MGLLRGVILMSRRRFFAPPGAFNSDNAILQGDEARHLREVLRLKAGDTVNVFDGTGKEFRCTVGGMRRDEVSLENCVEVEAFKPESQLALTLGVALLKGEKFDLVVQKATELGATAITPVTTRHADIHLRDASDAVKRVTRWRRIALEAAKQSGRAVVPEIEMPVTFDSFIQSGPGLRLMFSEREGTELGTNVGATAVRVLVGSEGGWSDQEITSAREAGWKIVTLGGRIMRAETAAIAVCVLLQNALGDLR
ncbi:MAG: 16S rRNA (uracil(1498)-N(3))-methyltransferase [Acidobacteria bacterium]|nr:MAG: 16S rRNA (uracil(1498)-N(3))-methyltransferase [Acidobacteriota bacterium]